MRRFLATPFDGLLARRGLGAGLIGVLVALALLGLKPGAVAGLGDDWLDRLNQIWPRESRSEPVVIVAIDEGSVQAVGAWPWPRAKTAELLQRIAAGGPAAVGVDMLFSEPETTSPAALARRPDAPAVARAWLEGLESGDDALAAAIAAAPVVLGVGDRGGRPAGAPSDMTSTLTVDGPDPAGALAAWRRPFEPLRSDARFTAAADGEGVIVTDEDFAGTARRAGQVYDLGGGFRAPGLAIEMVRVASGANRIIAVSDGHGVRKLVLTVNRTPVMEVATEADGTLRPWFGPRATDREISAIDLLANDAQLARLEGKFVLVGYTAAGGLDERVTPLGDLVPGVEIHRQILEGVFDQTLLRRPVWAGAAEGVAAIVLAGLAAFLALRLQTAQGAALGVGLAGMPLLLSFAAYATGRLAFDGATPALIVIVAFLPAFAGRLALGERARRRSAAAQARLDGEMAAAKRMQMGILPNAAATFPGETRFSIAAVSEPARTVGGDLYDFFLLDERRLFFLVGDVAGKGPEASLFMAISKSLCKSVALRDGADIGRVLRQANIEIGRDNSAMMFVTVFAGVLDVGTGALEFCCAGHEPPWRVTAAGAASRLAGVGGPPLCLLDDFDYPTDHARLAPGETIFVVTDGVTEAANRAGELFGVERTEATIRSLAGLKAAAAALAGLVEPVHAYADGEEPADDLTALVVIWPGGVGAME